MIRIRTLSTLALVTLTSAGMIGCAAIAEGGLHIASADAESKQQVVSAGYTAPVSKDALFTATLQSMSKMAPMQTSDRESGTLITQKGNWLITSVVTGDKKSSAVDISCRYVPGKSLDFNSRDKLTKELADLISQQLGKALTVAK